MEYLVCLMMSASQEYSAGDEPVRVLLGNRLSDDGDDEYLTLFFDVLHGLDADQETTYDTLRSRLPIQWSEIEYDDIVNVFGDLRGGRFEAFWTFDLLRDVLRWTNPFGAREIPLAVLRERSVSFADMTPSRDPTYGRAPFVHQPDSENPDWEPQLNIDPRLRAFVHRLLRDFNFQWRHILRHAYNQSTLRRFAQAIIWIATLDFEVHENTGRTGRGTGLYGKHVTVFQLPPWEPIGHGIVDVGDARAVVCQTLQDGLSTVKCDAKSYESQKLYIILSVQQIMLCRTNGPDSLEFTAPELLFNGDQAIGPPSDTALDYLLWATTSARLRVDVARLQSLPIEIQDNILDHVSAGTVEAARLGCLLGVGSIYLWKDGFRTNERTSQHYTRPSGMPAESLIYFEKQKSGVVYLATSPPRPDIIDAEPWFIEAGQPV